MRDSTLSLRRSVTNRLIAALAGGALLGSLLVSIAPATVRAATVIHVPGDFPTIKQAVEAAVDGDTVLVDPGAYPGDIDFAGRDITVESTGGASVTTIDAGFTSRAVNIPADPGETPVLRGFTITHGGPGVPLTADGAIDTTGGQALIENNIITDNRFCDGGAIDADFSTAIIRNNTITNNTQMSCSGGVGGAGISVGGAGAVQIRGNVISGNTHPSGGGGIALFAAGNPIIDGNVIRSNNGGPSGGGIDIVNASNASITNNVITGNTATHGGGVAWLVPSGSRGPILANNTIVGNTASQGSALYADGFDVAAWAVDNILIGGGAGAVLYCGNFNDPNPPQIVSNDVVSTGTGPRYGGLCSDRTGTGGNISAAPSFVDAAAGNYHLSPGSAGIDAGTADHAAATDLDGQTRPIDGDGNGVSVHDVGADEADAPVVVTIDITPGASPNVIKITGKGQISVGVLTTPSFNVTRLDAGSTCFGDAEAPAQRDCTLASPAQLGDLDGDGDTDLLLWFDAKTTGIDRGDTSACLGGTRDGGVPFQSCDAIVVR